MVIKADELVNKIVKDNVTKYKKAEKTLDAIIKKNFDGEKVKIWDYEIGDMHDILKKALLYKYQEAGWSIKEESVHDPREGTETYYIFTPRDPIEYNSV